MSDEVHAPYASFTPVVSWFHGQQNVDFRLPGPYPINKELNLRTVTPTFCKIEPFGGYVEGFSRCGDGGYAFEAAVRSDDFEQSSPDCVNASKRTIRLEVWTRQYQSALHGLGS